MSLKTEMLGLASIAELPLVCVNVQRGGPSTGIPTKGEQSDLFQAAFSAHGDVIRPVLAPVSAEDMFADHDRGLQHRRALPDAGHHPVGPGGRAAQGDGRAHRRVGGADRSSGSADREGTRALHAVPVHRDGHQPDQPPRHEGRQLPGVGHRAQRAGRADGQRRDAQPDERQAAAEVQPAQAAPRPVHRRGQRRRAARPHQLGQRGRHRDRGASSSPSSRA